VIISTRLLALWLSLAVHQTALNAQASTLHTSPLGFRQSALEAPLPEYPTRPALERVEGKIAVEVLVNSDGSVKSVDVIEGADPRFASGVVAAVKRWRFRPIKIAKPESTESEVLVQGRLLFYFTVFTGRPLVIDAAAAALCAGEAHVLPPPSDRRFR
jgi:TonB family protein